MEHSMDRRFDERFPAQLDAKLTDLATQTRTHGTLADISKSGIGVLSATPFERNSLVKLEVANSVLFGSVAHCTPQGTAFRVGIEVVRVLIGGTDLAHVLNAVLLEALPATPGLVASGSSR